MINSSFELKQLEKWKTQVKLVVLAKRTIVLDELLDNISERVRFLQELYEEAIEDAADHQEQDRQIQNPELKLQWEMR